MRRADLEKQRSHMMQSNIQPNLHHFLDNQIDSLNDVFILTIFILNNHLLYLPESSFCFVLKGQSFD